MADETPTPDTPTGPGDMPEGMTDAMAPGASAGMPSIQSLAQYVKDLSVENPRAPKSLQDKGKPKIDLGFNIEVNPVQENIHEVTLKVDCSATTEEGPQFVIDLAYAGLFALHNIPDDQMQAIMLVELPRQLFPFARQVIAEATGNAGYQPLLLDPIDFGAVYMQQMRAMAQQQQGQMGDPNAAPADMPPAGDA